MKVFLSFAAVFYTEMTPTGYSYKHIFYIDFEASSMSFQGIKTYSATENFKGWNCSRLKHFVILVLIFNAFDISELQYQLCDICHW